VVDLVQTPDWRLAVVFNRHPVIHFMNWVVILIGGGFLIWWTVEHHLSRWQFFGIFLLVALPYTILENWAKRKVKLSYLRNNKKRLAESPR